MYTKKTQGYTAEIVRQVHRSLNYDAARHGVRDVATCCMMDVQIAASSYDFDPAVCATAISTSDPSDDCPSACCGVVAMSGTGKKGGPPPPLGAEFPPVEEPAYKGIIWQGLRWATRP